MASYCNQLQIYKSYNSPEGAATMSTHATATFVLLLQGNCSGGALIRVSRNCRQKVHACSNIGCAECYVCR